MSYSVIDLDKFKNQVSKIKFCKIEVDENLLCEAKEKETTPSCLVYYLLKKQIYLIAKNIWKVIGCNLYLKKCGDEDYYSFFKIENDNFEKLIPSEARQIYFDFLNSLKINIFNGGKIKIKREIPSIKEFPKYLFDCKNWFDTNLFFGALVFKNDFLNRSIYKYFLYGKTAYCIHNNKFEVDCMDNGKINIQMIYDYLYGDIKDFEEKYKNEIWYWQYPINTSEIKNENENPANFLDRIE